jgi:hypothetical protein
VERRHPGKYTHFLINLGYQVSPSQPVPIIKLRCEIKGKSLIQKRIELTWSNKQTAAD